MSERLYHFTCSHQLPGVVRFGLSKGQITYMRQGASRHSFIPGFQWLTTERDFERQAWATSFLLHQLGCDRPAWRVEVHLPRAARGNLVTWEEVVRLTAPWDDEALRAATCEGSEAWRAYEGDIPADWLGEARPRPVKERR